MSSSFINYNENISMQLSQEELRRYFELYKEGNLEARNTIITHNMRLVFSTAKRFSFNSNYLSDYISVGMIGLVKAVDNFDYEKNIKFSTFAINCIANEIFMYMRKEKRFYKNKISMEQNNYEEPEINLNDRLFDYRDNFEEKIEDRAAVDCIIESFELLNEVERKIIEKRVLSGEKTQRELAILLNLSQSYVSRIERKTLLKIRKYLIRRGIDVNLNQTKVRRINEKAKNIYHN